MTETELIEELSVVISELELLKILKTHLKIEKNDDGFEKIVAYTRNYGTYGEKDQFMFCNFFGGLDKNAPRDAVDDFKRVKEWLEK